jgi:MATE family multidrug resistance protein
MAGEERKGGAVNRALQLQRLALPLTFAQFAFAANTFVTNYFLSLSSTTALHAALPGSMLAVAVSSLAISTLGYSGTIFANRHGAGDESGAVAAFRAALALSAAAIPYFFLAAPLGHAILGVFNTSAEVLAAESAYYDVLLANGFFTALAAVLGGYFTGQGKTRFVGAVTVFGFAVNMALAPVFIGGMFGIPTSGVRGAGWAATIAHVVPCIVLAVAIRLRPVAAAARQIRRADLAELLRLGLPNGIRAVIDIGGFFVFAAVLAECAPAAVAASTAAFAVNGIFQALPQGLSQALEILTARETESSRAAYLKPSVLLTTVYAAAFCAVLMAAGKPILLVFGRAGDAAFASEFAATAGLLVAILGVKSFFESIVMTLQSFLRGRGETAAVFGIQLFSSVAFWIPLFLTVRAYRPGIPAYWLTMIACSGLSAALLARRALARR